jgi:hypothetical protein
VQSIKSLEISSGRQIYARGSRAEIWNSSFTKVYLQNLDTSESEIDQIRFGYPTDSVIIFPFRSLKWLKETFQIECDQMIRE